MPLGTVIPITLDGDGRYSTTRDISGEPDDTDRGVPTGWWSIVAPHAGVLVADTSGTLDGPGAAPGQTYLIIFAADGTTVLAEGAAADPADGVTTSRLEIDVTSGTTYLIAGQSYEPFIDPIGDLHLEVSVSPDDPPEEHAGPSAPSVPDLVLDPELPTLHRRSLTFPAAPVVDGVLTEAWLPTAEVIEGIGTLRVVVEGIDRTTWRGGPVVVTEWTRSEPFGSRTARLTVAKATPFDGPATITWLDFGAAVDIVLRSPTGTQTVLWSGEIMAWGGSINETGWEFAVELVGSAWRAAQQVHQPEPLMTPADIGTLIRKAFVRVVSHRYASPAAVTTGITTSQRGSSDQTIAERVSDLLAIATTDDGTDQWTVAEDTPRHLTTRLKDRATQHWTVTAGAPGVFPTLDVDRTAAPNCIYGSGIRPDGYAWSRRVYPLARNLTYVPYPGSLISLGDTGSAVEKLQQRLVELGYRVAVDGTYSAADRAAVREAQRDYGLTVDGVVGPQTWSALFPQYPVSFLDNSFRLPLAVDTRVKPRLYRADGSDAGANPGFVAGYPRIEVDIAFGENISRADATRAAQALLLRDREPAITGTIDLACDPQQGSMLRIREGQNIRLSQWGTPTGPLLHIAEVTVRPQTLTATLRVDERARDLLTLAQIKQRNIEAKVSPSRLPPRRQRTSSVTSDSVIRFDGESPAGRIRKLALIAGLWVYVDVPVSEVGTVASLVLQTSPATKFCVAFFGDLTVRPVDLVNHVGSDPLSERGDGYGPFDHDARTLEQLGFIQAYGGDKQGVGYDHNADNAGSGYETSPYTGTATPVTGCLRSSSSWSYRSTRPPFLRMFVYSPVNSSITGRLLPAPLDL